MTGTLAILGALLLAAPEPMPKPGPLLGAPELTWTAQGRGDFYLIERRATPTGGPWTPFWTIGHGLWGTWSLAGMSARGCQDPSLCIPTADGGVGIAWQPDRLPLSFFAGIVGTQVYKKLDIGGAGGFSVELPNAVGRGRLELLWDSLR